MKKEIFYKLKLKIILDFFYIGLIILIIFSSLLVFFSSFQNTPYGVKIMAVQSGSMSPTIPQGSLVFTKAENNYKKGDIISFRYKSTDSITTTHRIVDIREATVSSQYRFITKGDANNTIDPLEPIKTLVLGKVFFWIPLIGYFVLFSKTLPGLVILIIIPATIIVYNELILLKQDILKKIREIKQSKKK